MGTLGNRSSSTLSEYIPLQTTAATTTTGALVLVVATLVRQHC